MKFSILSSGRKVLIFLLSLLVQLGVFGQTQDWRKLMDDRSKNIYEVKAAFEDEWRGKQIEKGKGYKQYKRWEWFMEQRCFPSGDRFAANAVEVAMGESPAMFQRNAMMPSGWTYIGNTSVPPGGGVGRVNSVRNLPGSTTTLFACAPGGGLWKTTNGGTSWTVMNTDFLASIGVSDIAIDPSNNDVMYIATGDGFANDTYSLGVLKTTDGGATWNSTNLPWTVQNQRTASRILIHPTNTQTVIVATSIGIYRTTNGGTTWTQVRTGNFKDLKMHPTNPNILYAASDQFFRSSDGGITWTQITSGLPAASSIVRMALAVSIASPDYVYILAGGNDYGFFGLYRSTDAGVNFSTRYTGPLNLLGWSTTGNDTGGQAWYDLALEADPTNAEIIYTGGVNIWKSSNGGTNWSLNAHWFGGGGAPYVHADIHALYFIPNTTTLLVGCDGGVFRTTNGGTSYTDLSSNLQIGQQYRLGVATSPNNLVITGWQDNGTNLKNGNTHTRPIGGDGMECIINPANSSVMYGSLYYGEIYRSNNSGASFNTLICNSGGTNEDETGAWVTPYVLGSDPTHLYVGKSRVYRSTDSGANFTALGAFGSGNINALHVAPADNNYIYASKDGALFRSTNGNTFTALSGLPGLYITYITTNPNNALEVYVTFSGFTGGTKIYRSLNGGTSWSNISGSLPNIPANCVTYQAGTNGGIYVGTDAGVYYYDNDLGAWQPYMNDLPNVVVTELEIHYPTNTIIASTYGRGLWSAPLFSLPALDAVLLEVTSPQGTVCAPEVSPVVSVLNAGENNITSIGFEYTINGGAIQTFTWTGTLLSESSTTVNLPVYNLGNGAFDLDISIVSVNGGPDENPGNNNGSSSYFVTGGTNDLTLTILTDCYPTETTWAILDGAQTIYSGGGLPGQTSTSIDLCLPDGCFDLVIYDSYGDGLSSSNCPDGDYSLVNNANNQVLVDMTNASFLFQATHNFCLNVPLEGCTDPGACNYDAAANVDDGSCTYGVANDVCANAITIATNGVAITGNNLNTCNNTSATLCGGLGVRDVWYSFTYNGGDIVIQTSANTSGNTPSLTDTRLALYSACNGTLIACNDDISSSNFYSRLTLACNQLTVGQEYFILVGGYQALTGHFNLSVTVNPINGCTNPEASNYNVCATVNDGSCIIPGCTNSAASNYNPDATVDNGTCIIPGCTNSEASNYNPDATVDNGTCIIPGCTNSEASNYNPDATVDNGTCIIPGCTNSEASNYNPDATVDNGTCIIPGCTNSAASNYNPDATVDNGTCIIPGCTNSAASNYNPDATVDNGTCIIPGCTNSAASNYNPDATVDNGTCIIPGCTNSAASNYNPDATVDNGSCIIQGCTNSEASNYNPDATVDNGTCIIPGCTNSAACNYNALANQNDGSCIMPVVYYLDNDGDGYGQSAAFISSCSAPVGYAVLSGDCNDNDDAVYPNNTEVCNGIDDDCDTVVDEGCGVSSVPNDSPATSAPLTPSNMGSCNTVVGTLIGATPSLEAQSTCLTGEDVWYHFTAQAPGLRASVLSASNNLLIELQDADGNMVNVENVHNALGNEILNYGDLTPGEMYYISVRNYNSAQGAGEFSICLNNLYGSTCDYGPGPYTLCSVFKADHMGTSNYVFHFTPSTGGNTITHVLNGSTKISLNNVPGLAYNTSYSVTIDAVYTLTTGNGTTESVVVTGVLDCPMIIGPPPSTFVRPSDVCPATKNMGNFIQATPNVCRATGWYWEITRTDIPQAPIYRTINGNNRNIQLTVANGFAAGGIYSIRVRPNVNSPIPVEFGPARCVQISGGAGMIATDSFEEAIFVLYPNPSNNFIHLESNLPVNSNVNFVIRDLSGRQVMRRDNQTIESQTLTFDINALSPGVYIFEISNAVFRRHLQFIKE